MTTRACGFGRLISRPLSARFMIDICTCMSVMVKSSGLRPPDGDLAVAGDLHGEAVVMRQVGDALDHLRIVFDDPESAILQNNPMH